MTSGQKFFLSTAIIVLVVAGLIVWAGFGIEAWRSFTNDCFDVKHGWTESTGWFDTGTQCVVDGTVVSRL